MSHFAKVENNIVVQTIAAEQDVIDTGIFGHGWIQTSYNTRGNVHYGPDGLPDGGIALRGNYASVGDIYDDINDVFYSAQPFPSWSLNTSTWTWEAPVPYPDVTKVYRWNEENLSWIEKLN